MTVMTAADARQWLGIQDTRSDDLLLEIVAAVEAQFVADTGRTLDSGSDSVTIIDGTGDYILRLPEPVRTGTPTIETRTSESADWVAVASSKWDLEWIREFRTHGAFRTDGVRWPRGRRLVRVTQNVGYADTDDLPGELKTALLDAVAFRFRNRVRVTGNPKDGAKERNVMPQHVDDVWELYRRGDFVIGTMDSAVQSVAV